MENAALQKEKLTGTIDQLKERLVSLSTFIYRNPELGFTEVKASKALTDFLKENGFEVELGYAGLPTAFRAVYKHGEGGPTIGLLCEYDALKNLGHGCGHHLQGPAIVGAALAVKKDVQDYPYTLEVIGTPGEECPNGGKNIMLENGAFKELDITLQYGKYDANQDGIKDIQRGILEFVDDYMEHFEKFPYMLHISGRDAYAPMLLAAGDNERYLKVIEKDIEIARLQGIVNRQSFEAAERKILRFAKEA